MLTNCALPYFASRVHSRMQPNSCRTAHFRSAMIGPLYVHSLVALPVVDARLPAAMATAKMTDDQVKEVCRKCVPARERTHACARMPIRRYGHADARTHSTHAQHLSHTSWQRTRFGREHPHNDRPSSPSFGMWRSFTGTQLEHLDCGTARLPLWSLAWLFCLVVLLGSSIHYRFGNSIVSSIVCLFGACACLDVCVLIGLLLSPLYVHAVRAAFVDCFAGCRARLEKIWWGELCRSWSA